MWALASEDTINLDFIKEPAASEVPATAVCREDFAPAEAKKGNKVIGFLTFLGKTAVTLAALALTALLLCGVVTVLVQGDMEQTPEKTYHEHTHEFHLNKNGRLVGAVEYSFTDQYINQLGTEGRFYMKGWSHVKFKETKVGVIKETIESVAEEVRTALNAK